jgi:acetyltransferase-like isoleucine patch superfamily enzyme
MQRLGHISDKIKKIIKPAIVYGRYDEYSIAKYFRKQGAQIGEGCSIMTHSLGTEPYLVKIGNHVTVAGGVVFATHDGAAWICREQIHDIQVFGPISIEDNCVIGHDAILFPNIRIGKNSIVGAGSVVISDVPPDTIAMGVPARPVGSVEKYKQKCIARWNEQKPPGIVIEPGRNWWNSKHYKENRKKLRKHLTNLFSDQGQTEENAGKKI